MPRKKATRKRKSATRSRKKTTTRSRRKSTQEKHPEYMVQVSDPRAVRKDLLEGLKEVIMIMQAYEHFKKVKEEKIAVFNGLKNDVKEINAMISSLKFFLPKGKLTAMHTQKLQEEAPMEPTAPQTEKPTPPRAAPALKKKDSDLDNLEGQLRDIERQLKNIQ